MTEAHPMKPKIFLIKQCYKDECYAFALAEDGEGLYRVLLQSPIYARQAMNARWPRYLYSEHYPRGYELVDYLDATDDQLDSDMVFINAYLKNNED